MSSSMSTERFWAIHKTHRDRGCTSARQLRHIQDYDEFLDALDLVWQRCFDAAAANLLLAGASG